MNLVLAIAIALVGGVVGWEARALRHEYRHDQPPQVAGAIAEFSRRDRELVAAARQSALCDELFESVDQRLIDLVAKTIEVQTGYCNPLAAKAVATTVWLWLAEGDPA